jgi:multiple sugar transport system permease protein
MYPSVHSTRHLAFTPSQNELLYAILFLSRSSMRTVPVSVVVELTRGDASYCAS